MIFHAVMFFVDVGVRGVIRFAVYDVLRVLITIGAHVLIVLILLV